MDPETMMLCDAIDDAGRYLLWLVIVLAGVVAAAFAIAGLAGGFRLAIRYTIRLLYRRMGEHRL